MRSAENLFTEGERVHAQDPWTPREKCVHTPARRIHQSVHSGTIYGSKTLESSQMSVHSRKAVHTGDFSHCTAMRRGTSQLTRGFGGLSQTVLSAGSQTQKKSPLILHNVQKN